MHAIDAEEITDYWNGRARTYSNGVRGELSDERRDAWEHALDELTLDIFAAAASQGRTLRVLDLGCGPGFFSIIFAEKGCSVDAVDASSSMLERARENIAARSIEDKVALHCCDVCSLPFPDASFDLAVVRNVTWLMRDPEGAYTEWLRVLKSGAKLLVFDANWYLYLVDPAIDAARRIDQTQNTLDGWDEDSQATSDEEKRCEMIAMQLPMTPLRRPAWDLETLPRLGASNVHADEDIWRRLWTKNEQAFYASSPMFLVEAVK